MIQGIAIFSTAFLALGLVVILVLLILRQRSRLRFGVTQQFGQNNKRLREEGFKNLQVHEQQISQTPVHNFPKSECTTSGVFWSDSNERLVCGFDHCSIQPRLLQLKEGMRGSAASFASSSTSTEKKRPEYFAQVITTSPVQLYPVRIPPQFHHPLRTTDAKHAVMYTCQTPPPPYEELAHHPPPPPPHKPSYIWALQTLNPHCNSHDAGILNWHLWWAAIELCEDTHAILYSNTHTHESAIVYCLSGFAIV